MRIYGEAKSESFIQTIDWMPKEGCLLKQAGRCKDEKRG